MRKIVTAIVLVLTAAAGFAACATASDEVRCKREGGTWRQTFCETQAK